MTLPAPTYDLVLLIDPRAEDATRAKIVADTRAAIEAQGELLRHDEWGERPLTYPIEKQPTAEYHLLQFHVGDAELLSGLDRTLRITDGVVRFRIVKLKPGVPAAPDMRSTATPPARQSEPESHEEFQAEAPALAEIPVAEPA
ncbi:MAG TPA: 30S ribosomal protein S6 [Solirubrobacteraceae bacterium]|nr:30S ribosomal protein S6 [Solirubrobacteraceae bacterium]